jgi:hypothetical protein
VISKVISVGLFKNVQMQGAQKTAYERFVKPLAFSGKEGVQL